MKLFRHIAAIALIFTGAGCALADETAQSSPYSMMGYGVLNDHISASQRAMGGVGYALRSNRQVNVKNPASYAAIDSMTFLFDIGADVGQVNFKQDGLKNHKILGGLDYITMQVPIGKRMGASVGLLPYSSVGYRFGQEIVNGESAYQGSGGISEAYIGFAGRPAKGLSLGFNAGYLFGNVINDVYVTADNGGASLYERVIKVRDYNIQFGAQYGVTFSRVHNLSVGVTYTLGKKLHGNGYGVKYDISTSNAKADTIGYTALNRRFSMPWSLGAGIAYKWDNRLTVGLDFTYQPWSKARFDGIENFSGAQTFADRYKGAVGAEYIPSTRGDYFSRVAYRVGAYYSRDYMMIGSNNVKEWGLTCGFGFPTPLRTAINVGFEYRHRDTSPVATLRENYFMVTLGIALNEVWFVPSKIR